MQLYLKHLLIGTPLERPLTQIRPLLEFRFRWNHPELEELYREPARIDQAVQRIVRKNSNCIDVGGHLGSMLNQFQKLAPEGKHFAFEPVPQKAEWLKRKFPKVIVHGVALGDQPGQITFYENLSRPGYSSMHLPADSNDQFREVVVPCARLDSIVPQDQPVHFMKVDVEGAELLVFRGAERIMQQQRPHVLFECTTAGAKEFGSTHVEVFDLLTGQYQYDVFLLKHFLTDESPLTRAEFEKAVVYPFQAINFIAVPRNSSTTLEFDE